MESKPTEGSGNKNNFKVFVPRKSEKSDPKDDSPKFGGGGGSNKKNDVQEERINRMLFSGTLK